MADKAISELVAVSKLQATDSLVVEQNGAAMRLPGQVLLNWLTAAADGHGGISSIVKQSTSGLTDTYRITMADTTTFDFPVKNGRSIISISKVAIRGLVDTYRITYNDGTNSMFTVTNGDKGDKGDNAYVWIRYAAQEPTAASHNFGVLPDNWMGIYSGYSATAPTDWTQYQWFKIKGEKGNTGNPATLTGNDVVYQVGTSGTVVPSGEWSGDVPNVVQGRYLWTRVTTSFNTGEPIIYYSVSRFGVDGAGSVVSVNGISPDDSGDVKFPGAKGKYLGFTEENKLGAVDLPSASTTAEGITRLVDSYTSTDTGKAATPKAVNEVYKLLPVSTSVTLTAAGWSSGAQAVNVPDVTTDTHVIVAPAPASRDTYINSDVRCTSQGMWTLTFTAASTPPVDITVNIIVLKQ